MSLKAIYDTADMSTPGTPLVDEVEYASNTESPPLQFEPYGTAKGHSTFLNYRNPEGSAIGGATTGHSGAVDQNIYSDPSSSEFKHRKVQSEHKIIGADPNRRRSSTSDVGLTSNGLLHSQRSGRDAVDDMSRGGRPRSWSEQPLVLAGIWIGIVGVIYLGWVIFGKLGEFNKEGKRSVIDIL